MRIWLRGFAVLWVLAFALSAWAAADSLTFSFSLLPSDIISGSPGQTVGWGYSITNNSLEDFLQLSGIGPLSGLPASWHPVILFDFPELAPGATFSEAFDPIAGTGFLQVTVPAGGGSVGTPECGCMFSVSGEFFSDFGENNPLGGFTPMTPWGVNVSPEPATIWLVLPALLGLVWRRRDLLALAG